MNRNDYKNAIDQIEPDAGLENRLAQGLLSHKPSQIRMKPVLYILTSLLAVLIIGIVSLKIADQPPTDSSAPIINTISIPKIKLPDKSNDMAAMVGLVVYKGNIYTQTTTSIAPEAAKSLLGEKLGQTKAGIDEWSEMTDYDDLASSIGVTDIFSVKGYDSDFRIMSYREQDGKIYAELYEHLNGIMVTTGRDIIGKTQIEDNMESVSWQDYNSWSESKPEFNPYPIDQAIHTFMTALYEAKPVDEAKLYKEGIYNDGAENQKVLFIKLKDQTEVRMWLIKGNYVKYASTSVLFQLEPAAFSALWNSIHPKKGI
ncbi:hypothetical protein EHS13_04355 [Paenibacillus psychroresistens]|uniref:Uncharacterized protein n=1 Tax=Paenibacillus psychroresistens TaxID=1778678 RepID=A0A6B8RF94_9BACL|nr:hypothetical protein [Paenibacillus psychroresistens]QGQ94193.1 hypothetical protein EHS13_04355 [Paenibacillus psychroresistens]